MMTSKEQSNAVDEAITSRRSVRGFLPDTVDPSVVKELLAVASRAPSGTNIQPWKVYALFGERRRELGEKILRAYNDPSANAEHLDEYDYYPKEWIEPYISRRRKLGWDLYGLLDIQKGDKAATKLQHGRNYTFFDAPVGLFFVIDRAMGRGSWLDMGMFVQNVMVAARGRGLHTCPQAAFNQFHRIISEYLGLEEKQMLVCGMSLGYEDASRVENSLHTERVPVDEFATFLS